MKILFAGLLIVSILGSFYCGSRVGSISHQYADAQFKAAILTEELKSIRNGTAANWITTKEIELNGLMVYHNRWEKGLYKYIWPQAWNVSADSIRSAAFYRKQYPFEVIVDDPVQKLEWDSAISEIVNKYSK